MKSSRVCQNCGTTLAAGGDDPGYCPACILRQSLLLTSTGTPLPETPADQPLRFFGHYELGEEIGRGGMGVVYKARQQSLKRTVAIKLLVSGAYSSESLLRRFQIEAESAAGLQHPGIVAIHEIGEHDHQPFYAMEYVKGQNLAEVSGGKPLAPAKAAAYARAIAAAVQYAHSRGILHRDLKPSNVLIDADDRPRITDFGLAKQLHEQTEVTVAGQMLGSPNYSSPEQTAGRQEEVGVRSDIYSLGALLYHLLTGRPPFLAGTMQETVRLVHETDPIPLRTLNPDVPPDLDTICLKCLEKTPAKRYASAQELADELDRFLKGEPILARPISEAERFVRWGRRHPAIASLAATVAVALTATSAIFYSSARRIERARAEEQRARLVAEEELYASNMLASSLGTNFSGGFDPNDGRARLDASRPRLGMRDQRGFEWRYYWTLARSDALAVLAGHRQVVDTAFFSPDGKRLATHSIDGTLKIWNAADLRELQSVDGVACPGGFTRDGSQLVFSRPDNSIWRLDLASRQTTLAHAADSRLIAALPDGRQVVMFGPKGRPVLRTLDDPKEWEKGDEVPPDTCAVVSADGRMAAVAGRPYEGKVLVFELATGRQVAALFDPRPVIGLALSSDGTRLVTSGFDTILKVWDVPGGRQEHAFKAFIDPAWGLSFSPDGKSFAASGHNRDVKIWDTSSWEQIEILKGHTSTVHCVAYSPDGSRLISGAEDEKVLVWPAHANRPPELMTRLLRGPGWGDRTPGLTFSPDSRLFAGTAADGAVKVWRTDTTAVVASYNMEARTVAFAPDGKSVLGEAYDGSVRRWMLAGEEPEKTINPKASFANWQVDSLTPRERVAFVADQASTRAECRLCEIPSARDGINAGAMFSTPTIAMSPDGRTMFFGLPQGSVEVWDVETRQQRFVIPAHKLNVSALAVSADGKYLATGSLDNSTKLWETATGQAVATFHFHNRPVWAIAFSPDGQTLAAGSCDKQIILCSIPLRRHVASLPLYVGSPSGFEQEVRLLRFSPDGNILAAALGDGSVRFFRAAPFSETDANRPAQVAPAL